ncbi:hypothetical protein H8356DRAFT_1331853 [Neocallimastix lanati (nom. inval.)]|nr:hypothetical protein H8356DRAFT_1331853 [Neocallimastix sp. JGI-2020a]
MNESDQWLWTIEDFLNLIQNSNIIYLCYVNTKLDKDEETILINFSGLKEQGGFSQLLLKSNWFYLIDTMIDMDRISIKNLI